MRIKERIKPFLDKIDIDNLFNNIWKLQFEAINTSVDLIKLDKKKLYKYWIKNPDLRFSQLLVNYGYIPNIPGFWYYMEEPEILVELKLDPAECYYWGINFDKDMNKLPETIYKPIKELSTDHLQAILDGGFVRYNTLYREIMENELKRRENEN